MTTAKPAKKTAKKPASKLPAKKRKQLQLFARPEATEVLFLRLTKEQKTSLRKAAPSYVPLAQWCLGVLLTHLDVLASRTAAGK